MHWLSKDPLTSMIPEKKHETFSGTNRGNALAFVSLPTQRQLWHATVEEKKALGS